MFKPRMYDDNILGIGQQVLSNGSLVSTFVTSGIFLSIRQNVINVAYKLAQGQIQKRIKFELVKALIKFNYVTSMCAVYFSCSCYIMR